jgi:hypothetical protein
VISPKLAERANSPSTHHLPPRSYNQQWNLTIQCQLTANTALTVGMSARTGFMSHWASTIFDLVPPAVPHQSPGWAPCLSRQGAERSSGLPPITLKLLPIRSQAGVLATFADAGLAAEQNLDELTLQYIPG